MFINKESLIMPNFMMKTIKLKSYLHNSYIYLFNFIFFVFLSIFGLTMSSNSAEAATNYYIRADASGYQNGTDWANAYKSLPSTLVRGATYYIADGSYGSYTFDDSESGSIKITIKKATSSDHGTDTGWSSSYGDGQAVFNSPLSFTSGYYMFDGNGSHSIPSNNTNDYGFKVITSATNATWGIIAISASDVTIKYTHVYSQYDGSVNNGTVSVRMSGAGPRIKIQNCYLENSGKDGIQISGTNYVLVERCYLRRLSRKLSGSPDYHGQAVQIFYGGDDAIFRWNIWDGCEGQALISTGAPGYDNKRLRFYGNVVFSRYNSKETAGLNTSGGIIGNAWAANEISSFFIYNNTYVNLRDSYTTTGQTDTRFPVHGGTAIVSNLYRYNEVYYNCETSGTSRFSEDSHHASGGYGTAGGGSEQTNLTPSFFMNYTGNNFRLSSGTTSGKDLSSESWWDNSDSFFGFLDSAEDMDGNIRGSDGVWDRGAFEFSGSSENDDEKSDDNNDIAYIPSIPNNLKITN